MIPSPYLLYLGHSSDPLSVKTSRGVAAFRGQDCVGDHFAEADIYGLFVAGSERHAVIIQHVGNCFKPIK